MIHRLRTMVAATLLLAIPVASHAALSSYVQSFESLIKTSGTALSGDGWYVYGNVYSPDHSTYYYGYGPYGAPNGTGAFCAIDSNQGGADQGVQQLSVYSDYNNQGAQTAGQQVEANVYREQTVAAADVGNVWTFQFDAKMGNLLAPSTAVAFIKTLNPAAGYATTNFKTVNTSAIPATWNTYFISITIDASLVGQLLQIGFANTCTNNNSSGVFYDNIVFSKTGGAGVALPTTTRALALSPAWPNPFHGTARLDWSLPAAGAADVAVYDVTGRRVATLHSGMAEAGPHTAQWNGRFDNGAAAPAGVYNAVLRTAAGTLSRKLVLTN